MVRPALRRAWRDLQYVQFGVAPAHAVVVGPVDTTTGSLLELLDGTRDVPGLREEARRLGVSDDWLEGLLNQLARAGLLEDTAPGARRQPGHAEGGAAREVVVPDRLRADAGSLSVVHRGPGEPLRRLAARSAMRVQVRGAGRVGAAVAALLSAAGVGRVDVLDGGRVRPWDVAPGGLPPESVGEGRAVAARRLVARSAPGGAGTGAHRAGRDDRAGRCGGGPEPALSLVVVAPRDGLAAYAPDPATADAWVGTGTPHLFAGVLEATGVVGPLVLPGGSACARCVDLGRVDADPAWPRLLAQWRSGRQGGAVPTGDVGLAAAVAGLAAAHALAFLDGGAPASVGARWEVASPLLEWRSRRLRPHGQCPCGAAEQVEVRAGWEADGTERERASGVRGGQDTMAG